MEHDQLQAIADAGSKIQYTGAGIAVFLSWLNMYAGAFGVLVAFLGLAVNVYYRRKAYKLLEAKITSHRISTDDYS